MTSPARAGWHIPAEWERQIRCWMAWPCRAATWGGEKGLEAACVAYAEVARAIADFEPVTMVCNPDDAVDVSLACGSGIQVFPLEIGDSWVRDTGPSFLVNDTGAVAGVHGSSDATTGQQILEHLNFACFAAPLVLEGGAFSVDGAGTVLVTEQCLLDPGRNPQASRKEIEAALKATTGTNTVIWLGQGYQDDKTHGHVDHVACFIRPGVVLALTTDDPGDGNFKALQDNLDRLQRAQDSRGRLLEVVPVRQPDRRDNHHGRLVLSYTSLTMVNGAIILPGFEDSADQEAYRLIRRLFPKREVLQIPALDIAAGGGGLHRMTLQQPAPLPIPYDPVI